MPRIAPLTKTRPMARSARTTTTIVLQTEFDDGGEIEASLVGLKGSVFGNRYLVAKDIIVLGRDPEQCDVIVDDVGVSRRHAEIRRTKRGFALVDCGSKNGTLVEGAPVTERELEDGFLIAIGKSVLKFLRLNHVEVQYHDKMTRLSSTDDLTGAYNRRHAWDALEQEISRSARHERPLSVILFDIDHFKNINDTYGHAAGDQCLVELVRRANGAIRREDMLARIGGEEFIVVLPDCEIFEAAELATRLCQSVAGEPVQTDSTEVPLTISLGVTDFEELKLTHGLDPNPTSRNRSVDLFVALADAKLYEAKHLGRNRVAI